MSITINRHEPAPPTNLPVRNVVLESRYGKRIVIEPYSQDRVIVKVYEAANTTQTVLGNLLLRKNDFIALADALKYEEWK